MVSMCPVTKCPPMESPTCKDFSIFTYFVLPRLVVFLVMGPQLKE